jgi:hypothetical protein
MAGKCLNLEVMILSERSSHSEDGKEETATGDSKRV